MFGSGVLPSAARRERAIAWLHLSCWSLRHGTTARSAPRCSTCRLLPIDQVRLGTEVRFSACILGYTPVGSFDRKDTLASRRATRSLLAALAFSDPMITLPAVSLVERQDPHDIELEHLVHQPQAYRGMRVKFATFVQTSGIFDSFHTQFTPERSINVVVWDDQERIREPTVRARRCSTTTSGAVRPPRSAACRSTPRSRLSARW